MTYVFPTPVSVPVTNKPGGGMRGFGFLVSSFGLDGRLYRPRLNQKRETRNKKPDYDSSSLLLASASSAVSWTSSGGLGWSSFLGYHSLGKGLVLRQSG